MSNGDLSNYGELGYNIDYRNGYNPSSAPGTSYDDFKNATGKSAVTNSNTYKAWADSLNSQYTAYLAAYDKAHETWYNSEAEKLSRLSAIGQNPFYNSDLSSAAADSRGASPIPGGNGSDADLILGRVQAAVDTAMQLGSFVNNLQNSQADRELTTQKAISQGLENRKQLYLLGLEPENVTYPAEDGELPASSVLRTQSKSLGLSGRAAKAFSGMQAIPHSLADSPLAHLTEGQIANFNSNSAYKDYQLNNILPSIASMYRMEAALKGLPADKAEDFNKKVWPMVENMMVGSVEYNPKQILEEASKHINGWNVPQWIKDGLIDGLKGFFYFTSMTSNINVRTGGNFTNIQK